MQIALPTSANPYPRHFFFYFHTTANGDKYYNTVPYDDEFELPSHYILILFPNNPPPKRIPAKYWFRKENHYKKHPSSLPANLQQKTHKPPLIALNLNVGINSHPSVKAGGGGEMVASGSKLHIDTPSSRDMFTGQSSKKKGKREIYIAKHLVLCSEKNTGISIYLGMILSLVSSLRLWV